MSTISALMGNSSHSYGLNALRSGGTAATFAHEIVSRARRTSALGPAQAVQAVAPEPGFTVEGVGSVTGAAPIQSTGTPQGARNEDALAARLESALAETVDFLSGRHGGKAGTAAMGIMAKSLGEGKVDEASLSTALMRVVKFVDTNFGIEEGDALVEHLNGSLNDSLNAFFDNGHNEQFIAKTTVVSSGGEAAMASQGAEASASLADGILAMLDSYTVQRKKKASVLLPYQQPGNLPPGVLVDAAA